MTGSHPFKEMANFKPLFMTVYAAVIIGIVVSSFYVFSAIYDSSSSLTQFSGTPSINQESDSSLSSVVNALPATTSQTHPSPLKSFLSSSRALDAPQPELNSTGQAVVPNETGVDLQQSTAGAPSKLIKPIWELPPSGSRMPPKRNFRLTKELVQQRVKDNIIIITFGNYAFMDFILTCVKHLTDFGLENILVGAMDTKLLEALYWRGVPAFDMGSHLSTTDAGWGTHAFHKIGREKIILIDAILPFGFELLMFDTDVVWLKNPLPYLARFPEADVLISTDQVAPTVTDDRLDIWQEVDAAYNIGIFHWRPTNSSKKLVKEWKETLLRDENTWDQTVFNELVRRHMGPSVDEESGLVYAYDGELKLGLLPASIFCSGHTYFVQAMYKQLRLEPYAVHATFQYAGSEGKRHRFREAMAFYDPPEYYDSPGGFLTFKPSIPKSLLLDGEHNIESHFSLVNYQIKQIRTALAVASLLDRTLVMPPLWCRLDRLWFGHPGVLVGSMTRQPFICPLDHILEVNVMLKDLPEDEFGPSIRFREFSFFDNPSMPEKVKKSWLDVHLCQEGSHGCQVSNISSMRILKFPKRSNEETYKVVFSTFKDIKVIQFSSMQDAFIGFTDKSKEAKFRNRVKQYTGIWCCVENHTPGHIYYDMYWDEKPDWKPKLPQTPEEDHRPL